MDRSRYEDNFLGSLWAGLGSLKLCHDYRVTSVALERDGDSSVVRIRLGRGDRLQTIFLNRLVWTDGQDIAPDFMAATLTTAIEEWTCARDTPRERDEELGEIAI